MDPVDAFLQHRRHLLDIATRLLGDRAEAEDVVQEAYARLLRAGRRSPDDPREPDEIDDVGGWLVVVVSRLCIDRLRADARHPTNPADTIDEQAAPTGVDPADRITLDDRVRLALHVVLERLTAAERAAFVLHDVFQYPFDEVGAIVGRSPAACRQLASRARRAIREDGAPSRFVVESREHQRVAEHFIAACATGDLDALVDLLDPDAAGEAVVGGPVGTRVITGREAVAANALLFLGPATGTTMVPFPAGDDLGIVALVAGRIVMVATLAVHEDRIHHIHSLVDPLELAPLRAAFGPT
jgi:RNA polymerase sigma-70 factor (ECF subfamily)